MHSPRGYPLGACSGRVIPQAWRANGSLSESAVELEDPHAAWEGARRRTPNHPDSVQPLGGLPDVRHCCSPRSACGGPRLTPFRPRCVAELVGIHRSGAPHACRVWSGRRITGGQRHGARPDEARSPPTTGGFPCAPRPGVAARGASSRGWRGDHGIGHLGRDSRQSSCSENRVNPESALDPAGGGPRFAKLAAGGVGCRVSCRNRLTARGRALALARSWLLS